MLGIGEKLRVARQEQNLSLRELAAKAEVSASMLSQIENGKANPSVRSLHSIADALGKPIDYFFPNHHESATPVKAVVENFEGMTASEMREHHVSYPSKEDESDGNAAIRQKGPVQHAADRPVIELKGGVQWARLTAAAEEIVEFLEIIYVPGASSGAKMSHHVGREFGLVLEGELQLELGFEQYLLESGDSIIFDSNIPHRLSNPGSKPMRAIWIAINTNQ